MINTLVDNSNNNQNKANLAKALHNKLNNMRSQLRMRASSREYNQKGTLDKQQVSYIPRSRTGYYSAQVFAPEVRPHVLAHAYVRSIGVLHHALVDICP